MPATNNLNGDSALHGLAKDSTEVPHSRSVRPRYSRTQINSYLDLIALPSSYRSSPLLSDSSLSLTREHGLPFLAALMRQHLAMVPFENLALHYSIHHDAPTDVEEIYINVVERRRGGMCMQMNSMFGTILRSLGFEVMCTAGRVNTACQAVARNPGYAGPSYNGWDHMVNIVTLSSQRYLVDVGMGARGPMIPLPLVFGATTFSISPRKVRLLYGHIPEHNSSQASNALWKLEMQNEDTDPWIPTYAFPETEFLPVDFEMMNWYICANRKSWFTHKVLIGKALLDERGEEIVGDITLYERFLRKRIHGKLEMELECTSEKERLGVLGEFFGLKLTAGEQNAIQGTASEIP